MAIFLFHCVTVTSTVADYKADPESTEKPYHDSKIFKSNEHNKKRIRSAPNTPEKQTRGTRDLTKRANTSGITKSFSQVTMQSPLNKEAYGILYPYLPPLESCKKPLTPQKFKEKSTTQAKKCLFSVSQHSLFKRVFSNAVIVANIFRYMSDGDLYRLSMVSPSLKNSLALDVTAYGRYKRFSCDHKSSKENYRITPPKSPRKEDGAAEASPGSKNFYYFYDVSIEKRFCLDPSWFFTA